MNSEARHGIWNYISAHKSMLNTVVGFNYSGEPMAFLFEDSEMVENIEPYIMARIVDAEEFFLEYPFPLQPDFKFISGFTMNTPPGMTVISRCGGRMERPAADGWRRLRM